MDGSCFHAQSSINLFRSELQHHSNTQMPTPTLFRLPNYVGFEYFTTIFLCEPSGVVLQRTLQYSIFHLSSCSRLPHNSH